MKNYRNGREDVAPPLQHRDLRPCWTLIGFGGSAIIIGPGPFLSRHPSNYEAANQ